MLLTFISFFLILSLLVLVHEIGHFFVAKKAGIKVEEFGLGLPPRIWGKKIGETIYSLNALPIGGFVKLYGEEGEEEGEKVEKKRQFVFQSPKVRAAVIVAGVIMNFLLGVAAFTLIYSNLGIPVKTDKVKVVDIAPNSPAENAGLKKDDVIVKIDGLAISDTSDFITQTGKSVGQEIKLEISRNTDNPCKANILGANTGVEISCIGENMLITLKPRENPPAGEGPLGVVISNTEQKFYPWYEMIFRGSFEGLKEATGWLTLIAGSLVTMVSQLIFHGAVPSDVAGPIGIFQITGTVVKTGWLSTLQFIGILSINLAVINILPLPALDGGRLVFIVYEMITRKKPNETFERRANTAGFAFLLFLIGLVTLNDVIRILNTSGVFTFIKNLFQ
jgi:regulator of sigma E protease